MDCASMRDGSALSLHVRGSPLRKKASTMNMLKSTRTKRRVISSRSGTILSSFHPNAPRTLTSYPRSLDQPQRSRAGYRAQWSCLVRKSDPQVGASACLMLARRPFELTETLTCLAASSSRRPIRTHARCFLRMRRSAPLLECKSTVRLPLPLSLGFSFFVARWLILGPNFRSVVSKKIVPAFFKTIQSQDADSQKQARKTYTDALREFGSYVQGTEGPFVGGKEPNAVDISLAPWAVRAYSEYGTAF